jgi:ribosomal subunit interface protein
MKFQTHSPQNLFNKALKEYAESKLQRPIKRHKLNDEGISIRVDASESNKGVDLRVSYSIPGFENQLISCSKDGLNEAIDFAADKMERILRDISEKRKVKRDNSSKTADYTEELGEDDYLTDGEEDVLKELGALDTVLDI